MTLFEQICHARGLSSETRASFLLPSYDRRHDPFLLPDMEPAVDRLKRARASQEKITIYGDYDIDGLTATTVLLDALGQFGFMHIDAFIPNRFVEGYGLTIDAIERIAETGATLIITVDCGSLSEKEICRAAELGIDVIVTDHHNVASIQPPAVAVINPKRLLQDYPDDYEHYTLKKTSTHSNLYPFLDLPGVGVAFKLVQALQTELDGMPEGQEKWLLDLVALGTVCDVVSLVDENRLHVFWGLRVLAQTRRPGLKALMAVARVEPSQLTARHLGFGLGPRMNAAGRLETAQYALDMLRARDGMQALEWAERLDQMNSDRRNEQDQIYAAAVAQAEQYTQDPVLVVSAPGWNHGIIGIVAAKLLEKFKKPTYVLEEMGKESKGSARSYGDFSAADAIRSSDDLITKGGGHTCAAGVTLPTHNIAAFRARVNEYYRSLALRPQLPLLLPEADVSIADFAEVTEQLIDELAALEPYGNGNPEPVLRLPRAHVVYVRRMGSDAQHVKLTVADAKGVTRDMIAFTADPEWFREPGEYVDIWFQPIVNEWRGNRNVEGRLVRLEVVI